MRKITFGILLIISTITLCSWGIWGHFTINQSAIFALPKPIGTFFYNHIDFISEGGNLPDLRKYSHLKDKIEGPRHFIDVEDFGDIPFDSLKFKKFDDKSLQKWGYLPWFVNDTYKSLVTAMKGGRKTETLFTSSELAHYIADAHMPLHTSTNHDGQLTNQRGIHAHWEALLVERYARNYKLNIRQAQYIKNIDNEIWNIIKDTHSLVDTLLKTDKKLRGEFPEDKLYLKDADGKVIKNKFGQWVFSPEYSELLHKALNGMVEKQMQKSIMAVADFWYTAWIDAGKPDLLGLDQTKVTHSNKKQFKKDLKLWNKGIMPYDYLEKEY